MKKELAKKLYNTLSINEIKEEWLLIVKDEKSVINFINNNKPSKRELASIVAEKISLKATMEKQIKEYENNIILTKEIIEELDSNDEEAINEYEERINDFNSRIDELKVTIKNLYK